MPAAMGLHFAGDTPAATGNARRRQAWHHSQARDFALVWPIVRIFHKASAHPILANISPIRA